ncbi:hypothetical protein F2Q70_00013782 [Brassica cretica]|uniref:Uncharacterized protein n=1 Tax=Brassica cretica TaxID=69181 RepID=A0A8S9M8S4_BRACR|nr:hypothetical protein F2Q70_00013782 [Brassica cretica]
MPARTLVVGDCGDVFLIVSVVTSLTWCHDINNLMSLFLLRFKNPLLSLAPRRLLYESEVVAGSS